MPDGLNKVMLIGNLGTDPEMRYTPNGNAVTSFRIAVSRTFGAEEGRREETDWFTVVSWNKLAELVGQHMQKGRKVFVEGRLQIRNYDAKDGTKRYVTEIIANQVLFLDRPQGAGFPDSGGGGGMGGDIDPDDLPFEN